MTDRVEIGLRIFEAMLAGGFADKKHLKEAICYASELALDLKRLSVMSESEIDEEYWTEVHNSLSPREMAMQIELQEEELSVRTSNCLKNSKLYTMGDLVKLGIDGVRRKRNFGKKSIQELAELLNRHNIPDWIDELAGSAQSKRADDHECSNL